VIVVGVATLGYALLWALAGDFRQALSSALVGGGLILIVTWARGFPTAYPIREWIAFATVAAGLAVVGQPVLVAAIFVSAFLLQLALTRSVRRRMPADFDVVGPDEVMPGAERTMAAFEAAGFRRAGGYAGSLPKLFGSKRVVFAVLTGPDSDRFAVVTDRVVQVISRVAGGRWLITSNSGVAPVAGGILRQKVPRGTPEELARAHQAAVDVLSSRGTVPDRFAGDEDGLEAALELERHSLRSASNKGVATAVRVETRGKAGEPVLGDDGPSRERVDAWLGGSVELRPGA
jgi:hypothetical protein